MRDTRSKEQKLIDSYLSGLGSSKGIVGGFGQGLESLPSAKSEIIKDVDGQKSPKMVDSVVAKIKKVVEGTDWSQKLREIQRAHALFEVKSYEEGEDRLKSLRLNMSHINAALIIMKRLAEMEAFYIAVRSYTNMEDPELSTERLQGFMDYTSQCMSYAKSFLDDHVAELEAKGVRWADEKERERALSKYGFDLTKYIDVKRALERIMKEERDAMGEKIGYLYEDSPALSGRILRILKR